MMVYDSHGQEVAEPHMIYQDTEGRLCVGFYVCGKKGSSGAIGVAELDPKDQNTAIKLRAWGAERAKSSYPDIQGWLPKIMAPRRWWVIIKNGRVTYVRDASVWLPGDPLKSKRRGRS